MSQRLMSGGRYPVLRAIAILYLIGAAVSAVAGAVVSLVALFGGVRIASTWGERWIAFGLILAATFFVCITLLVVSEVIKLFIDVEHNSRSVAMNTGNLSAQPGVSAGPAAMASVGSDNGRTNRMAALNEETAEGALIRGH